jgi:transcription factor MBP1
MVSQSSHSGEWSKPKPPLNYQPNWIVDSQGNTALHWASAMGDIEVVKELRKFGADIAAQNYLGETPLMCCVKYINCRARQSMPAVVKELIDTIDCVDFCWSTVLHRAATANIKEHKDEYAQYYLDVILSEMLEVLDPEPFQRILNAQDVNGNTALHIAAKDQARKSVIALLGRGAETDILNADKITAEEIILEMNMNRTRQ